ncbi:hypothetical protein K492DRAFT_198493 [Lichtheimia hyalospora FSU 10163]|nr:hypothetical protein K492DRAFT_198493 [Lichtheimia hyalospora FSU 10163]
MTSRSKEISSQRQECPSITRQFIQGPWWASLYRRGLVQKSNIDKQETYAPPPTTRIASSIHLVSSRVGLFDTWIRQPMNWMRRYQEPTKMSCNVYPEMIKEEDDIMSPSSACSSFSTSTISTNSSISTVEDAFTEHDSGCELKPPTSLYCRETISFDKQMDFDPAPRSWPPESQSSVISEVVQELSPKLADAWHKHEAAMKQYRQQCPIPPTQRRKYIKSSKRHQQRHKSPIMTSPRTTPSSHLSPSSSTTDGSCTATTRSRQLVDLARSALVYFENAYGHIPDGMLPMLREAAA